MTVEEAVKVLGAAGLVLGAMSGMVVGLMNLLPARIKATSEDKQRADEELRKQRDELRATITRQDDEIKSLKAENAALETKNDDLREQWYHLREMMMIRRARCEKVGTPCGDTLIDLPTRPRSKDHPDDVLTPTTPPPTA